MIGAKLTSGFRRLAGVTTLVLVSVGPLHAADENGKFALDGGGGATCEAFLASENDEKAERMLFAGWIDGYVTAYNQFNQDTYDLTPWQSNQLLRLMLKEYCRKNSDHLFGRAVASLAVALRPDRLQKMAELVKAESGEQGVLLYKPVLNSAQRALKRNGYYQAEVDGNFGPATAEAIKRFQTAHKIEATGIPDQQTLYMLFYASDAASDKNKSASEKKEVAPSAKPNAR